MSIVGNQLDNLARCVLDEIRKEIEQMREFKRKLTKEQYEQAQKGNWDGIFSDSEVWGTECIANA